MRLKTVELFKFEELSDEAKTYAIEAYRRDHASDDPFWGEEMLDSLKALFDACSGVTLIDYSLGAYSYSTIKVEFSQEEAGDLSGPRAMAWLENNLFCKLRTPFTRARYHLSKYGNSFSRPGALPSCPLTGVCFDEDFLDQLRNNVKSGMTLKDSFRDLADCYCKLLEAEIEYANSDGAITERLVDDELEFTAEGEIQ